MVIAVDIDDVLYPFADNAVEYVTNMAGKPVTHVELFDNQEVTASGLDGLTFFNLVRQFQFDDKSLTFPPLEGAMEALADLAIDHDVYLVTSRHPSLKEMTDRWLKMHIDSSRIKEVIFVGNHWSGEVTETKADVCQRIAADYLIEDQPRYVDLFQDHSTNAIMFGDYDWNTDYSKNHFSRASNWGDVMQIISSDSRHRPVNNPGV